jgi:selenium-dependent xanthine dehydrogenase
MDIRVNGKDISIKNIEGEMLSDLLRGRLGLTGTKIGCNEAECGSCTVLVDGIPILSCVYPAERADGHEILTIEGISSLIRDPQNDNQTEFTKKLHPLQQAFVLQGAVQCGYCIPGQIMSAYALLQQNPNPNEAEIRHALKDTLCRCGGYQSIIQAIQVAAKHLRGDECTELTISDTGTLAENNKQDFNVIGSVQIRPDAIDKVLGGTIFTDDITFEGMLHARVKRAGVPHAIVKSIDINEALELEGVVAILTADDIPGENNHGVVIQDWPVLVAVGERVRYVGDAIALVAAESRDTASRALDLIDVEYEPLPVVSDPIQASQPDSPVIHENGNQLKHIKVRKGEVSAGFQDAEILVENTYQTAVTEHAFIEPECSIARLSDNGRMEIFVGSQIPYADRNQVARALGVEEDQVRILGQSIGGGFGGKEDIAGQIHAALLAQSTSRPIKLLFDRHESFLVHPKRHATQIRVKIGAKLDGQLTAIETELYGDTGSYASLGEKVMTRATTHSSGPYDVPHARADCYAMYTNNPPAGAFRGFGVTQSCFAIESSIDELSEKLNIDPVAIRKKNALRLGSVTNTGQTLHESVGLIECIEKVDAELHLLSGSHPFSTRMVSEDPHLRRAWGFAVAYKNTGLGGGAPDKATAEVELYADGMVEVRTSSAEIGQGLVTILQMIVAEEFNLPVSKVRVLLSDTDLTPDGGPTTASRQTYVAGNAARGAAQTLCQAIATTLAEKFDFPPDEICFVEGLAQFQGLSIPLGEVAVEMKSEGREPRVSYEYWAPETKPLGENGDMHFAYSFAAQAAEVEVNTLTGEVRVLQVIAANDVGKALNPLGLQGQIEGGIVMGVGNVLTEEFIIEDGHVISDRLSRYRIPSTMQAPIVKSIVVEHPIDSGPYGAKGVGELSSIPTTPAVTNAIYNAVGVRIYRLPVDQEYLLEKIMEQSLNENEST